MPKDFRTNARRMNRTKRDALRWASWRERSREAARNVNWSNIVATTTSTSQLHHTDAAGSTAAEDTNVGFNTPLSVGGKWYMEVRIACLQEEGNIGIGFKNTAYSTANGQYSIMMLWNTAAQAYGSWRDLNGVSVTNMTGPAGAYNKVPANGDIWGLAFDFDNSKAYYHINGVWLTQGGNGGNPSAGNGFPIANPGTACRLLSYTTSSADVTLQPLQASHSRWRPEGYESITE